MLRTLTTLAAAGMLAFGVAACGDDDDGGGGGSAGATAAVQPVAEVADASKGKTTEVALDAGFVDALGALKVTPGVLGDAKLTDGTLSFPITGGSVKYFKPGSVSPFVQGRLDHDGSGLSLKAGGKQVELENFVIDPGTSTLTGRVSVDGEVAADSAPLFFLDGRTLKPLATEGSDAVLEGTTVKLKAEAAQLLNQTYGIDDLTAGLVIGVAKITLATA